LDGQNRQDLKNGLLPVGIGTGVELLRMRRAMGELGRWLESTG
jgi:hypothetical protein